MKALPWHSESSLCPQLWHLAEIPSWWHRPDWLADPACEWPCTKCKSGDSPSVLDERRSFHVVAVIAAPTEAETVFQGSDEPMETGQVKTTEGIIYTPRGKITLVRTSKCSLMDIVYWEWNC
ncbi:hypothetical protein T4E_7354 [Trichinella pseudospiralis]|uniref:Uncharacterized protein n=1 Tax=Trichinella pseudospiralis TaxID=6337 RepID=A0A0V0Y8U8_TRIPS|nr:hypothetical protein T4E_7354 [Trichinella pseudospiralis]